MIQLIMIFAIGALAMGLFGAFFLPAYKKRAVRLAQRELEARMPMSMGEVLAGRDALRAEAAAQLRAAEIRMAQVSDAETQTRAALGRAEGQILQLQGEAGPLRQNLKELQAEHATLSREHIEAQAQNSALHLEIYDSAAQIARKRRENEGLRANIRGLEAETQVQRANLAALQTRITSHEMLLEDLQHQFDKSRMKIVEQESLIARLQTVPVALEAELVDLRNSQQRLKTRHEKARARIQELEGLLRSEMDAKVQTLGQLQAAEARLKSGQRDLQRAQTSEGEARAALLEQTQASGQTRSGLDEELTALRVENASLKGALQALRQEHERRSQLTIPEPSDAAATHPSARDALAHAQMPPPDHGALRQSIVELGREMAHNQRQFKDQKSVETESTLKKLQDLQARVTRAASHG
ncbi:MAG: hypothetical protein KGQ46_00975 [Hyphomicrobiales bacterium]|nr:hypothetical protein [Hyphomicrobiales bacterium]MDE2115514.1 hypothetical protein [Hyphomicrobiales bacterium]